MGSSRTLNSLRNVTINLATKLSAILCSFVIRTIFLKYLGDQYTGVSTLFTDVLNILSFTELGIGTAVSFAFYKFHNSLRTEYVQTAGQIYPRFAAERERRRG